MAHHKKTRNGVNTYKYALKRPSATAKTSIILRTSFFQQPFYFGIGYSIYPELWSKESYRPTTDKKLINKYKQIDRFIESDIKDINTRIANIETIIDDYIRPVNRGSAVFDKTELVQTLNKSIKGIRVLKFDQVDMDFYNSYFDFLIDKDYGTNTIGKYISRLISTLNIALDEGVNNTRVFQNKSFAAPKVKVDYIALNDHDMERLENMTFPKRKHLQKALDTFLTGCYTLLRVSDYGKIDATSRTTIKDQNNREIECLKLIDQKTKKENLVPIQPKLENLLTKYSYSMPRIADQKVNEYIKEIAKEAGLIELVPITDHDKEIIKKIPKHKLITTHTARRTGATQYFYSGMSPRFIQRLLNHSKLETTENYIKLDDSEMIKRIVDLDIFRPVQNKIVSL